MKTLTDFGFIFNFAMKDGRICRERMKMGTLKENAEQYEPPETKNITDLEKVNVNIQEEERTYTREDGTEFKINVIVVNDEDFRVPKSVIKQLKEQIKEKPDMTEFKVTKSGTGMKTEYTVIPLV